MGGGLGCGAGVGGGLGVWCVGTSFSLLALGPWDLDPKTQSLGRLAALLDTDVFTDWLLDSTKLFYGQCYFTRQCSFLHKAVVYERKYSRTEQAF